AASRSSCRCAIRSRWRRCRRPTEAARPVELRRGGIALLMATVAVAVLWVRSPRLPCRDLCTYYSAGTLVLAGTPERAYDAGILRAVHKTTHDGALGVGPWLYSPAWLAPAAPLASLPFEAAQTVHRLLGALALALGLAAVLARLRAAGLQLG